MRVRECESVESSVVVYKDHFHLTPECGGGWVSAECRLSKSERITIDDRSDVTYVYTASIISYFVPLEKRAQNKQNGRTCGCALALRSVLRKME